MDKYITFEEVMVEIKKYIKNPHNLEEIKRAYILAEEQHRNQKRKSGAPYIIHPLWTAFYLAEWRMGPKTIIAGLLHDLLEDTPLTYDDLVEKFSEEIAFLVDSVTKVTYFAKENRTQIKATYLRKLYLSMAKDIRVIIIKLADRLHNTKTLGFLNPEKQKIIAKESLGIYSAIANRLGMKKVKFELEDLSFAILDPLEYRKICNLLEHSIEENQQIVESNIEQLRTELASKNISVEIFGRTKTIYSIYRKMNNLGKNFEDINDILAIRIITNTIDDCYHVLGLVHQKYTPLGGRFKDYIATPKNNLYQSLHTTIVSSNGHIIEVQIRTHEMDEVAEQGVAAHWRYKEGEDVDAGKKQKDIDERLDIFRKILDLETLTNEDVEDMKPENSNSTNDKIVHNEDFIEKFVQNEIFNSLVYALTPNGKVITLPFGSTILDFAYKIHSEVGEKTIGAKINGLFSPIGTVLKSGDVIEVKTSKAQKPSYSWLKIAKTNSTLSKIRKFLRKELENSENADVPSNLIKIRHQKNLIDEYIKHHDIRNKLLPFEKQQENLKKLGYSNMESFLIDVDDGYYKTEEAIKLVYIESESEDNKDILNKLKEIEYKKAQLKDDILIQGNSGIKITIASCCMPIPLEPVIGFITKQDGIKVHLQECNNIHIAEEPERFFEAKWNEAVVANKTYETSILINSLDRPKLIADVTKLLSRMGVSIQSINAKSSFANSHSSAIIRLVVKVANKERLKQLLSAIRAIPDVDSAERVLG